VIILTYPCHIHISTNPVLVIVTETNQMGLNHFAASLLSDNRIFEVSVGTFGSLFLLSEGCRQLGAESQYHHPILLQYRRSYPRLEVAGCHSEERC